ncbi:hypothetical protein [Dysgonomonas sp. 25]|uniref:hypothetical protein n=1 Tax=Dysgonomonas sp. 25 TaxID=2302933 RepID=UPI0013D3FD6C|nr:hypothetical protein [Dysgonomonas sp. 25]NDV70114.1 hypothetical protein [Dysgonomonas sp. 25]
MTRREIVLRNKLLKGMHLSYNRLIEAKQKENGALFFSEEGKIVKVKARNIKKTEAKIPSVK